MFKATTSMRTEKASRIIKVKKQDMNKYDFSKKYKVGEKMWAIPRIGKKTPPSFG